MRSKKNSHRALWPVSVLLVCLALMVFASPANSATYDVYGGTKASWPDGSWIPVSSLGDPDDDKTERLDFVGDTYTDGPDESNYTLYRYGDSTYAYFRVRVDAGAYTGYKNFGLKTGDWTDNIWIMINADSDTEAEYALAWDTKTGDSGEEGDQPHGLEFQIINATSTQWGNTTFNDIDKDGAKKRTVSGTGDGECDGLCGGCWHVDIPYTGGTGYVRILDGQSTTAWDTTMFIDIAVTWAYLHSASTAANGCDGTLPVLSASGNWKLQAGSRANANDHNLISEDVAGDSTPTTDPKVWSSDVPTLVNLVSFTATPSRNGILLEWETASEIDNAGFHIWRSDTAEGTYTQITNELIPAQGEPSMGAEYEYEDTDVARKVFTRHDKNRNRVYIFQDLAQGRTYYYKLEAIDNAGVSEFFGPVSADVKNRNPNRDRMPLAGAALFLVLGSGAFIALKRRRS